MKPPHEYFQHLNRCSFFRYTDFARKCIERNHAPKHLRTKKTSQLKISNGRLRWPFAEGILRLLYTLFPLLKKNYHVLGKEMGRSILSSGYRKVKSECNIRSGSLFEDYQIGSRVIKLTYTSTTFPYLLED